MPIEIFKQKRIAVGTQTDRPVCDICFVTAVPVEKNSLRNVLETETGVCFQLYEHQDVGVYLGATINTFPSLHIFLVWPSKYGPNAIMNLVTKINISFDCGLMVLTGFCAGDPEKTRIGDVIVANRTWDSRGKVLPDGSKILIQDTQSIQEDILRKLELCKSDWQKRLVDYVKPEYIGNLHFSAFFTGNSVYRDEEIWRWIAKKDADTKALDMEAHAFLEAIEHKRPAIIVKGVADYANLNKEKCDSNQESCSMAAGLLAWTFVSKFWKSRSDRQFLLNWFQQNSIKEGLDIKEKPSRHILKFRTIVPQGKGMQRVRAGKEVIISVKMPFDGYLILITFAQDGHFYCLTPSDYAPSAFLRDGWIQVPDENHKGFLFAPPLGVEKLVSICLRNPLLSMSPDSDQKTEGFIQLDESDIQELIKHMETLDRDDWVVMTCDYMIVS